MTTVTSLEQLEALYQPAPAAASTVKVTDRLTPEYRRLVDLSPFATLATIGPEGLDCSPRGDRGGVVRVADDRTLLLPDRRGNNRIDSLRNLIRDPRCALLFLLPGSGTTLRLNGRATISIDPDLLDSFAVEEKRPRSVVVITIEEVFFQCARAVIRSDLWNPARHIPTADIPTPGDILATLSRGEVGGRPYDEAWPERARQTMW
ncbi:pyridoxamine 5'-phosphate oxidase family protein [Devosia albogilva]|uniref:Pyridoxamine 5'-phosphate oxidase family protein n=1 Tax=Devosia albogilva TaxID=429726 RepID=A0ABW5QIP1_9HYPH